MKYSVQLVLVFSLFLFSCNKDLKKTTKVKFIPAIEPSSIAYLNFSSGNLRMVSFAVDGDREKGKDVSFEKEFSEGNKGYFSGNFWDNPLEYDIPQGSYREIEIDLEVESDGTNPSLILKGTYITASGTEVPLQIEFPSSASFSAVSELEDGRMEISLIEGIPAEAEIQVMPSYWFEPVPRSLLDNAVDGSNTIIISPSSNEDIYDYIESRIDDKIKVVFKQ